jgi:hypothetical protein
MPVPHPTARFALCLEGHSNSLAEASAFFQRRVSRCSFVKNVSSLAYACAKSNSARRVALSPLVFQRHKNSISDKVKFLFALHFCCHLKDLLFCVNQY